MRDTWRCTATSLFAGLAIIFLALPFPPFVAPGFAAPLPVPRDKSKNPNVRWDEQTPGCTFSHTDDGRYQYGMWSGDVGIVLSVDSQELEKVHHRVEPFFSVALIVRYRGENTLDFDPGKISLEFVKHFQTIQTSLDPDDFSQKIQRDADSIDFETQREIRKHPEKKQEKETFVRTFQKESSQLQEFVSKDSLRPAKLSMGNAQINGWVLFGVGSKWIGGWKKPEEFILRVPIHGKVFEFPFTLPPKPGEVLLRKRE